MCRNVTSLPPKVPLHPWKWPSRPFQRVHVDFCQKGKDYFLVLIDSHFKWIDVKHMTSTTTERTIDELRLIFAEHGLPEQLVSENGSQFMSEQRIQVTVCEVESRCCFGGVWTGDRWYLVQMGAVTRRVHADHFIRALDNQKMSAELGNSFVDGSCLQEFQSVSGPVGVQNQESALPRTDEEGVVPSMSGNDYTMPIASSPVAKETEVEGHSEMTLSPSEPLRRSTRVRKPVVRLDLKEVVREEL